MFSLTGIPLPSSLFSACASLSASAVLFQIMFNQLLPSKAQQFILSTIHYYFNPRSSVVTLLIEETNGMTRNEVYNAAEIYLSSMSDPGGVECRLKVSKSPKENNLATKFDQCEKIVDSFDGFELNWRFNCLESQRQWFELSFPKEHRDKVLSSYLPFVLHKAEAIKNEKKVVKLHSLAQRSSYGSAKWDSIDFEHPSSFDTLAMDSGLKQAFVEDLDRFVKRKEFYKRVGKAWKREYCRNISSLI